MRLKQYINETFDISYQKDVTILDNYLSQIKKTAKPWIRMAGDFPVFRGMKKTSIVMRKKVRADRKPKDTKQIEHEIVDKAFYDAFGWKPRSSGLFVVGDAITASGYGHLMMVLPIGKVSYLYSDAINDLYMALKGLSWGGKDWDESDEDDPRNIAAATPEDIKKNIIDKYTDKGIKNLSCSTCRQPEIMINCKEYWAIEVKTIIHWLQWKGLQEGGLDMYSQKMYKLFMQEAILK